MSRNTSKRNAGRNQSRSGGSRKSQGGHKGRSPRPGEDRPVSRLAAPKGDLYWLYGNHPVQAALDNPGRKVHKLICTKGQVEQYESQAREMEFAVTDREQLDLLFQEGAVHQGVAALVSPLPQLALEDILEKSSDESLLVILDQVTDPHNVGAVLRSAAVFGAEAVILPDRNAPGETAVMAKSASGALEAVPMIRISNLARAMEQMRDAGYWSIGLAGEGDQELQDFDAKGKIAAIMGAEGSGLRRLTRENCDHLVRIPMAENAVGSLNVSNAAAIVLYALASSRNKG